MRSFATVVALLVMVAGSGSVAWAQGPTGDTYNGPGAVLEDVANRGDLQPVPAGENEGRAAPAPAGDVAPVATAANAGPAAAAAGTSGGSLPFTGFDVLLLVAGGAALIGVGFAIRRFTPTVYE